MKKVLLSILTGIVIFSMTNMANAASLNAFVDGRSAVWDKSLNPAFPFGTSTNVNLPPFVVDSSSGLDINPGDSISIKYLSGFANAGGGGLWYDGEGVDGWMTGTPGIDPVYYAAPSTVLSQLMVFMGTFANNGVIVGQPFKIGNGPFDTTVPVGSNQLLLGFNDGWYNDNGDGINVEITSSSPVPEPSSLLLGLIGLAGAFKLGRKNKRIP